MKIKDNYIYFDKHDHHRMNIESFQLQYRSWGRWKSRKNNALKLLDKNPMECDKEILTKLIRMAKLHKYQSGKDSK